MLPQSFGAHQSPAQPYSREGDLDCLLVENGQGSKKLPEWELLLLSSLESMACHRMLISNHSGQRYLGDE